MASNWNLCDICDNGLNTTPSVVWCFECDKGLCENCKETHSTSKDTVNHVTVSIREQDRELPTEDLGIANVCKTHNDIYEFFCKTHDCPCCKICLKSHIYCKDINGINEVSQNVKTSNAFYELEQTLMEVVTNIKRIITDRKDNLKHLENTKKEIEAEMKELRIMINNHLDKLQDDLMKELLATERNETSKIEMLLTSLQQKENEIAKFQENLADIKQYASDLQAFLSMKQMEKEIAIEEKLIPSMTENDTTNQVNISCHMNMSLQEIRASVQTFGNILVSSDQCKLSVQKRKDRQAQIMVALTTRNIDNLTLTLQKSINTSLSMVRGCSLLPDGKMVVCGYHLGIIRVIAPDGSKDYEINDIGRTFDVVFIGDDSIAVTSGESKKINIIDLKARKRTKVIKLYTFSDGVVYKNGHLIYCCRNKGLKMINPRNESITNITFNKLAALSYVTTFGDKLFYTKYKNNSVTCCDNRGKILWSFMDTRILTCPFGISVDNAGNVFVVGHTSQNVVVISADGKSCRQILSKDGLERPTVLHYDTFTNKLLVANYNNQAFVYDVK